MNEVEGFLNGTTDYYQLKGDTGPLVYVQYSTSVHTNAANSICYYAANLYLNSIVLLTVIREVSCTSILSSIC